MKHSGRDTFRSKLEAGCVFGPFAKTCDPAFIEILGLAGFDFVILDMEHGPNSLATMQNLVRAAECRGLFPIVRVKEDQPEAAAKWKACGVRYLAYSVDVGLFLNAATELVARLQAGAAPRDTRS